MKIRLLKRIILFTVSLAMGYCASAQDSSPQGTLSQTILIQNNLTQNTIIENFLAGKASTGRTTVEYSTVPENAIVELAKDSLKYRILLKNKTTTTFSLNHPEEFLSEKSIARRQRQHLAIDSTDLPVCKKYINIIQQNGVHVLLTGKWENFVTVSCNDSSLINNILKLPFVSSAIKVWQSSKIMRANKRDSISKAKWTKDSLYYGSATTQIKICNGDKLHEAGYKGQEMVIAIIDAGFHNVDRIKALRNIHILGTKDFVNSKADLFAESSHGLSVLSCMAMNQPYHMVGTAPEASYWLLRTEDVYSENLIEQDYWSEAIEYADSVGVDVVNSSLGYYNFDDNSKDYRYRDLNGHYALISREASHAANKGIFLTCSAGNAGAISWKKITPPADADNILAVGAVDSMGILTPFSSVGNTTDHRIKPDVVGLGISVAIMGTDGTLSRGNGTSFSAPIICGMATCLWQAFPQLTAKQLLHIIRQSSNQSDYPNNIYGYGLPDMWKAYQMGLKKDTQQK